MTRPGFSVDLARAPDAIRQLEDAKAQLEGIRDDAVVMGSVTPPASDQVSLDAAKVLGAAANGGPGSFVWAANEGIARLTEMIESLRHELAAYQATEASARTAFGATSDA